VVSRPRSLERLKTGLQLKLTLVAAPAGYGKTTLLSEGVRSSQMPVGWLTFDEGDNDPTRFWSYVISAMQTVWADMGKSALGLLQSPQPPPIESIITTIINGMSEVSEEFALVLDDYHMIEAQPIHDSLTFLLNHLPPQAHLVIASRVDPPLLLTRLRAQGEVDDMPGLLERLHQKAEEEKRTGSIIEVLTLQSIALQAQGDLDQALAMLERALSLAEPEGYVRIFVDEGEPMTKLLRLAASRGIAKKYVRKLLASFQRPTPGAESQPNVLSAEGALAPSPLV